MAGREGGRKIKGIENEGQGNVKVSEGGKERGIWRKEGKSKRKEKDGTRKGGKKARKRINVIRKKKERN